MTRQLIRQRPVFVSDLICARHGNVSIATGADANHSIIRSRSWDATGTVVEAMP